MQREEIYIERIKKFIEENYPKRYVKKGVLNAAFICDDKPISYEDLCYKIPRKIGSRSTILNSLNNAVSKQYFIKETVDYDKRIKIYKLSSNFQSVMIDWINELKKVTSEKDN